MASDNTRRIIHVAKYYPPYKGGMEMFVANLHQSFLRAGVQSEVIAVAESNEEILSCDIEENIKRFLARKYLSQPFSIDYLRAISRIASGTIVLHCPNPLACYALSSLGKDARLIIVHHSDILGRMMIKPFIYHIVKRVYERAELIICTSDQYANSSSELKRYLHKVRTIPIGIKKNYCHKSANDFSINKKLPLKLICIARLVKYKGIERLIEVVNEMHNVRLKIVGEGPLENKLKKIAKSSSIEFIGAVSEKEKYKLLNESDLFVLPSNSRAEAYGIAALEALSIGLPILTTELHTGSSFINNHNITGLIVENSKEGIKEGIDIIEKDRELLIKFNDGAKARFDDLFTLDKMLKEYKEIFRC